jgi:transposase
MRVDYPRLISESEAELQLIERRLRGKATVTRVQMLRLLKSGQASSLRACAPLLGYSLRQLTRWWEQYQSEGLEALTLVHEQSGRKSQLTVEASAALRTEIAAGRIRQLEHAQRYLSEYWGIHYASLNGVWWMLRREQINLHEHVSSSDVA